jgi:hypothetical protein
VGPFIVSILLALLFSLFREPVPWACSVSKGRCCILLRQELIEYSTKHGKFIAKSVGPRGTGFETDLYSFPELPPNLAQYVEAEFFKFADDKAAIALQKHLRGETGGAGTSPGETITATRSWTRSAASAGSRSSWFSRPAIFDQKVPAFNVAGFVQTPPETGQPGGVGLRRPVV